MRETQEIRTSLPPSAPPPVSAFAGIHTPDTASGSLQTGAGGGRGHGGPGEGEREAQLRNFVSTLVDKWGVPQERDIYLAFCRKYPLAVLEEAFTRVLDTPRERIRKSPGALFVYLVKRIEAGRR